MESLMGLVVLTLFALSAFFAGWGTVRLLRRARLGWYVGVPLLVTVGSGYGVAWLLWPSYYIGPAVLVWWGCAFFGNISGWFCPARGLHA
ncbi:MULTISPECIES: hypothetical protein [unclassified Streptomyces]|uniref:hypothetical protein n=1 Tax=unclassified Streptomyces TaxID=2593676 RepID=UPI002E329036|nr:MULTISPECIES: hypothetical protein [unclassified Streptomyces]